MEKNYKIYIGTNTICDRKNNIYTNPPYRMLFWKHDSTRFLLDNEKRDMKTKAGHDCKSNIILCVMVIISKYVERTQCLCCG